MILKFYQPVKLKEDREAIENLKELEARFYNSSCFWANIN